MLNWIIESSLRNRFLVIAVSALMIVSAVTQLRNLPVNVLPEFSPPYVEVQTEALGLSATEVEQLITVPLEADLLNGVAWLKTIRSESIPGLSSIVLIFEPGTNVLRARQMVQERLTLAHGLPNVSKAPAMLQPLSSTSRVMNIGLTAKEISHIDMSVLARWTIRPRLMGVPGVANVSIWGQRKRQIQVQVDPKHLKQKGVSLHQVIKTAGDAMWVSPLTFLESSTPGTGGWIDTPNQRLGVRHLLPITTPEQLAKVSVVGSSMVLSDVAKVVENHQPLIGDAVVADGPGLMLIIEKFPWANTLEVTQGVEKALNSMRPGLSGMEIDSTLFRPATFVETSIANLSWALFIGVILAIVVLYAFFYNWRVSLISLASIATSLSAAALVLYFRGTAIDAMVFAGLVVALAAIIDDAIVDVVHIVQRLGNNRSGDADKSVAKIIVEASHQIRGVMLYATLIALLAVVPLFFVESVSGAFLRPLAISYGLALLASMLVASTVTPTLSWLLLSDKPLEHQGLLAWLGRVSVPVVSWPVRNRPLAYVAAGIFLVAGIVVWPQLGQQALLPSFKESDLLIEWEGGPGTSRSAMNRIVQRASQELRAIPGVRNVSAHVGRAVMSDEVVGVNSSELWVSVETGANYDRTVSQVQQVVDGYPGFSQDVLTYTKKRIREAVTGEDEAIIVRVYGQDWKTLQSKAEEVKKSLEGISGVVDARIERQIEEPTLEIKPDLTKAERHGIKPGDIRRSAAVLLSGIEVGSLFEEQKVFDVVVWGTPETRHSTTSVRELVIDTPRGEHVRLQDVADVRIAATPIVIKREGVARRIDVTANVRGRDLGSVASDVDRAIKTMQFPLEHHAEVLGEYAERQSALRRVTSFAVAAAIGVFLLMQAAFSSWRLAAVVTLSLPVAISGGVLAAFIGGGTISIGSLAGLLAVFVIATRSSIGLVKHFQNLEFHEGQAFGPELVQRGLTERIGPILMTALITALVLAPLVLFGNIAGLEIVNPMAIVILGGLVTSTLVNLWILPALYLQFGTDQKPEVSRDEPSISEIKTGAV